MSDKRVDDKLKELLKNVRNETDPDQLDVYADILQSFGKYDEAARARKLAVQRRRELQVMK